MVRIDARSVKSVDDLNAFDQPEPGRYHMSISAVDLDTKPDKAIIDMVVLAGTVDGQEGKAYREYLALTEAAVKRVLKFALATKIVDESYLGTFADIPLENAIGRDLIVDLREEEYTDKNGNARKGVKTTFLGFAAIGSVEAAGVPLGERPVPSTESTAPAATPQTAGDANAEPAESVVADDEWTDLV